MNLEGSYRRYLKITGNEVAAAILAAADDRPEGLLTPKQAADKLGVSRDMIYELCAAGRLRSQKIGRAVRIHPDDLSEFAA